MAGQFPPRPALYETRALADALTIPPADALRGHRTGGAAAGDAGLQPALGDPADRAAPRADAAAGAARRAAGGGRRRCERCWRRVKLGPRDAMSRPAPASRATRPGATTKRASAGRSRCRRSSSSGSSRSFRSSGRSGSRCTCTICGCRGSAGRSSAPPTTSRRWRTPRFWSALGHTAFFAGATVTLELAAGLALALALDRVSRGRGARPHRRAAAVGDSDGRRGARLAVHVREPRRPRHRPCWRASGATPPTWFADAVAAWVPLVLADVWKTTPFVALLLLAGLQNIDRSLYEAAEVDGAGPWRQFIDITLPLLRPALLVAFLFRALDAFRVFDVVYVMTGGGPGTATEPIALYTFSDAPAEPALRLRLGAVGHRLRRRVRLRAGQHPRCSAATRCWSGRHDGAALGLARLASGCSWRSFSSRCTGRSCPRSRRRAGCSARRALVPRELVLDHYRALFGGRDFWTPIRNSLIVAGATTALSVVLGGAVRVRAGAAAVPRQGAGAGVRAGRVDVPADLDRLAAVPAAARRSACSTPIRGSCCRT